MQAPHAGTMLSRVAAQVTAGGSPATNTAKVPQLLFVGCYTDATPFLFGSPGQGILSFRIDDPETGALTPLNSGIPTPAGTNPTYITVSADGTRLYCACEGEPSEVRSFAIDASSDSPLTPLNTQPGHGDAACWVTLDSAGKFLLAANYTSGSVVCYPIDADGSIGAASDVQEQSTLGLSLGPNAQRQEGPHAHAIFPSPTSPTDFYVPDLGLDKVFHYQLSDHGKLRLSMETSVGADGVGMGWVPLESLV